MKMTTSECAGAATAYCIVGFFFGPVGLGIAIVLSFWTFIVALRADMKD